MLLRFVAWSVLIFCLISVVYSTYILSLKTWQAGRKMLVQIRSTKIDSGHRLDFKKNILKLNRHQVNTFILDLITLNSRTKWVFIFYAFPIAALLSIPTRVFQFSKFTTWLGSFFVLITLLGLAKFLGRNFNGYWFEKINFYLLKLSIFVLYSLSFFVGYLQYPNNNVFFALSLFTTIVFSVYFLKSIIDGFDHIGFCVLNFFLVYLYDLLAIGLHFGFFYLQNNTVFKLYADIQQFDSFNIVSLLSMIQIGLSNFYSLSNSGLGLESMKNFVPFFEYVFGAVFNVGITGFFISYTASKIFKALDNESHERTTPNA